MALVTWDTAGTRGNVSDALRASGAPLIGLELLFIAYALRRGFEPLKTLSTAPRWVLASLVTLVAVAITGALAVAEDSPTAVMRTGFSLIHLLTGLAAAHLSNQTPYWSRKGGWSAILIGVIAYVLVLAAFVSSVPPGSEFDWRYLGLGVTNVRHLGMFGAVGASVALANAITTKTRLGYGVAICVGALMFALFFWSGNRAAVLSVLAAVAALAVPFPKIRTTRAFAAVLLMFAAGLAASQIHSVPDPHYGLQRISESFQQQSWNGITSDRLAMWAASLKAVCHVPFLGYGQGQFSSAVPAFSGFTNPHNILLQVILDWGPLGATAFLILGVFVFRRIFARLKSTHECDFAPALVATSLLTMSLYDVSFFHTYPLMMISLALGTLGADDKLRSK